MIKSKYPKLEDKDWLYQKYWTENRTPCEIAKIVGCNHKTVRQALKKQKIRLKTMSEAKKGKKLTAKHREKLRGWRKSKYPLLNDRDWLIQKYHIEKWTLTEIKNFVGCSSVDTVWSAFKRLNIERRTWSEIGKEKVGAKNSFYGKHHTEKTKQKLSEIRVKQWQSEEYIKSWLKGKNRHPNKLELLVLEALQKIQPNEWKYNGNFEQGVMIGGMIPDFVNVNGEKKVIEVFGDYWHDDEQIKMSWKRTEFGRKAAYAQLGYTCIVLWEKDLRKENAEEYIKRELKI